jgi:hypothetical protein
MFDPTLRSSLSIIGASSLHHNYFLNKKKIEESFDPKKTTKKTLWLLTFNFNIMRYKWIEFI